MLDKSLKDQISSLFSSLKSEYKFRIRVADEHPDRSQLIELLEEVASCSPRVNCEISTGSSLEFDITQDGQPLSVLFRAIPTGHEFTTLLLAILNLEGIGKNLPDSAIKSKIKTLKPAKIKSYISLTCTNCPDVVQALNLLSIFNPEINHEIIDGALYQDEAAERNIQAVPAVYYNDKLLHVGRADLGELLQKIEERGGIGETVVSQEVKNYDVIIAGGGPAGVTSAIYSARKGFKVAVVAGKIGGQVNETMAIENMISQTRTTGPELSAALRAHLADYNIDLFENRTVTDVQGDDNIRKITTNLGEQFEAKALIVATGASWKKLNVPGEQDYIGSGVAFCTHCDGPFYKGKKVVVVGGGNSGLEAAIDLSSLASKVVVLEFLDTLKGDQVLQDKLKTMPNVTIITNAATQTIEGDGTKVTGLKWQDRATGVTSLIETDGVFVQIGLKANSSPFDKLVDINRFGEIQIDEHCRTSVKGIYAAGDVTTVPFKQIVIAMGEGSKAALSAFEDNIKGNI